VIFDNTTSSETNYIPFEIKETLFKNTCNIVGLQFFANYSVYVAAAYPALMVAFAGRIGYMLHHYTENAIHKIVLKPDGRTLEVSNKTRSWSVDVRDITKVS
jgi:hypothetical protein